MRCKSALTGDAFPNMNQVSVPCFTSTWLAVTMRSPNRLTAEVAEPDDDRACALASAYILLREIASKRPTEPIDGKHHGDEARIAPCDRLNVTRNSGERRR